MAKIEFVIEPYGITNDIRWKSVTLVGIHPEIIVYRELTCQYLHMKSKPKSTLKPPGKIKNVLKFFQP